MQFLLFFDESWWTGINAVWGALGILILVAFAILILLAKGKTEVQETNKQRADASDSLVKVRNTQLADAQKEKAVLSEELEDVTAELRTVTAIKIDELFKFWSDKEAKEAHWANVETENRVLHKRLEDNVRG